VSVAADPAENLFWEKKLQAPGHFNVLEPGVVCDPVDDGPGHFHPVPGTGAAGLQDSDNVLQGLPGLVDEAMAVKPLLRIPADLATDNRAPRARMPLA